VQPGYRPYAELIEKRRANGSGQSRTSTGDADEVSPERAFPKIRTTARTGPNPDSRDAPIQSSKLMEAAVQIVAADH